MEEEDRLSLKQVKDSILSLRSEKVILDYQVACLYGVTTREINQAVRNNPARFPEGYVMALTAEELQDLRSKKLIANLSPKSRFLPKAFTERGLYMLATVLKSASAVRTSILIIDTFAQLRSFAHDIGEVTEHQGDEQKQKSLLRKGSELLSSLVSDELEIVDSQTSFELNLFATIKIKPTVKKKKKG